MHAVNPDLERLVQLQRAESELRRVEGALAEAPKHKAAREAALAAERVRLEAAREALAQCQKARRQHEAELADLEVKRFRYKGQLMDVKTNKEYTAMLHEIEGVEREIRAREDLIIGEMEKTETLGADVKREESVLEDVEERHRSDTKRLDAEAAALGSEARALRAARDSVAATVPESLLGLFQRVAKLRGVAVAEARDGMCQVCHLKLRLQMYAEIKRNEDIQQCPACNRILYYDPAQGVVPVP